MQQLTDIANSIITFINNVAVPLVFAVAFIVFLFGVFRYFIAGGANAEKRKEGTQLIMYSIIGFAVMIVVWGLVNLVVGTLGFTNNTRPALPTFSNTTNTSDSSGTSGAINTPASHADCRTGAPCPSPYTCNQSTGRCQLQGPRP